MEINSFSAHTVQIPPPTPPQAQTAQATQNTPTPPVAASATHDVYEPIAPTSETTQTSANAATQARRYSADVGRMREIWAEHDLQIQSFRRLVEALLQRQASTVGEPWNFNDPDAMVEIDAETRAVAQEAIEAGGYFSVDAVATRLLDFAVAISGGDPSRIEVLRDAVQRGFEAAERQWGGELPEISHQTFEAVMNGFNQWQEAGTSAAITLLNTGSPV
jgi:hypothetical protein